MVYTVFHINEFENHVFWSHGQSTVRVLYIYYITPLMAAFGYFLKFPTYFFNNVRVSRNEKSMFGKMFMHFPLNDIVLQTKNMKQTKAEHNSYNND